MQEVGFVPYRWDYYSEPMMLSLQGLCSSSQPLPVVKHSKSRYGSEAWNRYGFVNAFNPLPKWYDTDVIAIDTGITRLRAENRRTGCGWNTFMKNPEAQRGLRGAGFTNL